MKKLLPILFLLFAQAGISQNTVGTLVYNSDLSLDGYNLFYPNLQSDVFLVDNCGQVINRWVGNENTRPGISAKLRKDGVLIKAMNSIEVQSYLGAGGSGGVIEARTWDNELLWQHVDSDSLSKQHHDFELMPNGNILYINWFRLFKEEIIELGFDTINNSMDELWFDCIKEYNPELDSIVWQWCSYNQLIQEFNPDISNYGVVSEHPDLIDINYHEFSFNRADWMHSNAVAYNKELDQVALCVRNFNEVWIIDHSTTTLEATSDAGGNSNKGGRLLHRWGNPATYNMGDSLSRKLFFPHNAKWIQDDISEYDGEILVYNNVIEPSFSLGAMYETPTEENGNYEIEEGVFLPKELTREISHPDTTKNTSGQGSNIVLLENGNFFMQPAIQGRGFEITDEEEVVWEYVIPMAFGEEVPQGTTLSPSNNFNFSMSKYAANYSAFDGKDLSPKGYLELDPNTELCMITSTENLFGLTSIEIISNPVHSNLEVNSDKEIEIYLMDTYGQLLSSHSIKNGLNQIDINHLANGLYFIVSPDQKIRLKFTKL